jgi:putative hemolysin
MQVPNNDTGVAMKYIYLLLPLILAGCAPSSPKPAVQDAPPPNIGMANPASVYCQQKGGTLVPVQTPQGVRSDCKLPGGETLDEWALWRRDHPQPK